MKLELQSRVLSAALDVIRALPEKMLRICLDCQHRALRRKDFFQAALGQVDQFV